jgi:prepilin-type N-terminal cleavage/methylation domain-containing protein
MRSAHRIGARQVRGRSASRPDTGFTLIEMIIAMTIFAIAVLGLAGSMAVAASGDTHAGEQTRALALAGQKLEELKASQYTDVKSEATRSIDAKGLDASGPYKRTVTVEEGVEGKDTKSVTVQVDYGAGLQKSRRVQLYTVMYAGS